MIRPIETPRTSIPPEEVARRIAEMRRIAHEHHAYPQVVYHPPFWLCPWPGCGYCIKGIRFELEKLGNADQVARWLKAFWLGPGVAARCPGCKRYVLFDVEDKKAITNLSEAAAPPLPDNWYEVAYLGPQSGC